MTELEKSSGAVTCLAAEPGVGDLGTHVLILALLRLKRPMAKQAADWSGVIIAAITELWQWNQWRGT